MTLTMDFVGCDIVPLRTETVCEKHVSAAVLLCAVAWPAPDGGSLDACGSTAQTQRSALSAPDCYPIFRWRSDASLCSCAGATV